MAYAVRPYQDADSRAVLAVADAAIPYDLDGNRRWLRARQEVNQQQRLRRHYVVNNDLQGIVGYGAIEQQEAESQRLRVYLVVYPGYLRSNEGRALYAQLVKDVDALNVTSLWMQEYEQNTELCDFMRERGFMQTRLIREMKLSLARANVAQMVPIIEEVARQGIVVAKLEDERQRNPNIGQHLYELYNAILDDVYAPLSSSEFVQRLNQSNIIPQGFFLARKGDRLIGLSTLARIENDTQQALQHWTGVLPAFRRQHVATVMRLSNIDAAQHQGFQTLVAYTDYRESIVRYLNEMLGFHALFSHITLEKTVRPTHP